jgi:outer membrane protein TolC
MIRWRNKWLFGSLGLSVVGCATSPDTAPPVVSSAVVSTYKATTSHESLVSESFSTTATRDAEKRQVDTSNTIQQASHQVAASPEAKQPDKAKEEPPTSNVRPAYGKQETLPIDLPTVLRMVDAKSPIISFALAKVQEAQARVDQANALWLPNLSIGASYLRFDGQTQNQRGEIFSKSRANLFGSGGPALTLDTTDAFYRPLIERRLSAAEQQQSQAVRLSTELDAVLAYIDLVQVYAQIEINADILQKAENMHTAAVNAKAAQLERTAGDVHRAQTEVLIRKTERVELEGRAGAASARLGKLLLLNAGVKLVPAEVRIVPITLIEPKATIDDLVTTAIRNRPDLAANREAIEAAWTRVRREQYGPLLPKIALTNQTGSFGGGLNGELANFEPRNALGLQIFWELKNFGLGNRGLADERRAMFDQAQLQLIEAQARVTAAIVESAQIASAKYEALELAEKGVKEATELYRISREGSINLLDAKNLFDALRPLQAIQALNQAKLNYLNAVLEFNRAQYRLYTALGNPPKVESTPK